MTKTANIVAVAAGGAAMSIHFPECKDINTELSTSQIRFQTRPLQEQPPTQPVIAHSASSGHEFSERVSGYLFTAATDAAL